jgi:hypothetical protein
VPAHGSVSLLLISISFQQKKTVTNIVKSWRKTKTLFILLTRSKISAWEGKRKGPV